MPRIGKIVEYPPGWPTGFEPATSGTTIRGSTIELRPPFFTARPKISVTWQSAKQIFALKRGQKDRSGGNPLGDLTLPLPLRGQGPISKIQAFKLHESLASQEKLHSNPHQLCSSVDLA
jgi:hypothetical protein